jgi:hypothetical protein
MKTFIDAGCLVIGREYPITSMDKENFADIVSTALKRQKEQNKQKRLKLKTKTIDSLCLFCYSKFTTKKVMDWYKVRYEH